MATRPAAGFGAGAWSARSTGEPVGCVATELLLVASESSLSRLHEAGHPRVVEARARLARVRSAASDRAATPAAPEG
jgi:hypothetical protein